MKSLSENSCKKMTTIGGQALIEGIMMKGPRCSAMAVRKSDGEIETEVWDTGAPKWYSKVPIVRGIFTMISTLATGYKCLMRSADLSGMADEEEESKFEKWLNDHLGDKVTYLFNAIVTVLSLVIVIGLFMILPAFVVKLLSGVVTIPWVLTLIEGVLKIAIFITYLYAVTRMKDIQRVFAYHGAEHKTIACYEAGEELTPENARKYTRFHPRCGTSFLLIVLIVSIIVFSVVTWESVAMRVALKILLLPVVIGISYEIIRWAGRYRNPFTRAISAPGLWLQNLTTFEPDDSQLEVAIAALLPCIPENQDEDKW
ncbi:DUF1385 domain-containing protein [Youxingia wuxianensis]|nr:DUF1385 domain-containing protein [Youxingia wuxianensis]